MQQLLEIDSFLRFCDSLSTTDYPSHWWIFRNFSCCNCTKYAISLFKSGNDLTGEIYNPMRILASFDSYTDTPRSLFQEDPPNYPSSDTDDFSETQSSETEEKRRSKLEWTGPLHELFVRSYLEADPQTPKKILQVMQSLGPALTQGITRTHVSSHLQKYRKKRERERKRIGSEATRIEWRPELHNIFLQACDACMPNPKPKKILKVMQQLDPDLPTNLQRTHISSHLQKVKKRSVLTLDRTPPHSDYSMDPESENSTME